MTVKERAADCIALAWNRIANHIIEAVAEEQIAWVAALREHHCDLHEPGENPEDCTGCRIYKSVMEKTK